MKFAYVDETGSESKSDKIPFVMAGVTVDAYNLRKYTEELDAVFAKLLQQIPIKHFKELKTKKFINGLDQFRCIDAGFRKQFIEDLCELTINQAKATVYAIALSKNAFTQAKANNPPKSYWHASAMYICCLIQKKMIPAKNNKGLTVLIFDDNKKEMPKVSASLHRRDSWYDGLYQKINESLKQEDRFDCIVNTAFAINSEHSSFIQVADAIAYIYRRYLEIKSGHIEKWVGERKYYSDLVSLLGKRKAKLGRVPKGDPCVEFYKNIKYPQWNL